MHAAKALLLVVIGGLLLSIGVFTFMPGTRPGFVKKWFHTAAGYTPAETPEDALDKFKRALEKRDFEAASLYVTGDYKEWIDRGGKDAQGLGVAIDNLRHAMEKYGVKSNKSSFVLYMLDPFPGTFKILAVKKSNDTTAVASISWVDELARWPGESIQGWAVNPLIWNSMLPMTVNAGALPVTVVKEKDGAWRINLPIETTGRHLRDTVGYLRNNGSNFRNAINSLSTDVKNSAPTKENFEGSLKTKLEESK